MAVVAGVQASLGLESAGFITGLNQATAAMNNMASNANNAANNVNQSFAKVGQSARLLRGQFQNLAFQLQDVAVSLQMGMDPMRVFTQQAGQIAQIFGPMGAAIGVAVTVLGALGGAWLTAGRGAKEAADAADEFDTALNKQLKSVDAVIENFRTLNQVQRDLKGSAAEVQVENVTTAITKQEEAIRNLLAKYSRLSAGTSADIFGMEVPTAIPGALGALATPIAAIQSVDLKAAQKEFKTLFDELRAGAITAEEASIELSRIATVSDNPAIRDMAIALFDQVENLDALNRQLAVYAAQVELASGANLNGKRTLQEFNEVVKLSIGLFQEVAKARAAAAEKQELFDTRKMEAQSREIEQIAERTIRSGNQARLQATKDAASEAKRLAKEQEQFDKSRVERQNRELTDIAERTIRSGNQAIAQQKKARDDLNATLDETLALQKLQLQGLDKESEAYRVQEALIKAKNAAGGKDPTAEEERKIKLIEQQATAIDKQQEAAKEAEKIFDNMVESMQSALADTFEDIFRDGVTSFQDLADSITDIFVRMAAELAAKKLMEAALDPAGFAASLKGMAASLQGLFGGAAATAPGGRPEGGPGGQMPPVSSQTGGFGGYFGGAGGGAGGMVAGGVAGAGIGFAMGSTLFRTQEGGTHTGAAVGGTIGGAIGGAAFGPVGAMAGGALGGFIGRQFGAGKGQDNKVFFQGQLGIGAGGTGAAAALVAGIDDSIKDLLTATQEATANRILEVAKGVRAQYDKQMSPADMANLAAGRIGPAAQAIGLQPAKIAVGTPEAQLENLQQAIELLKQIEAIKIGPVATQFRDLDAQFGVLIETAARLGISTVELSAEQARSAELLTQDIRKQQSAVLGALGAWDPLTVSLQNLDADFRILAASAIQLGISTEMLSIEHQRQAEILVQQHRIEQHAIMETVGVMSGLDRALADLDANMQIARIRAEQLGISTAHMASMQAGAAQALIQQAASVGQAVHFPEGGGAPTEIKVPMPEIKFPSRGSFVARSGGGGGGGGGGGAAGPSREELERQRLQAGMEQRRLMETVGAISPLWRALGDLNAEMKQAGVEAQRLGISTANLKREHQRLAAELYREQKSEYFNVAQRVGAVSPFHNAMEQLNVEMQDATAAARRLGISTANITKEYQRLAAELYRQYLSEYFNVAQRVGAFSPFQNALEQLNIEMQDAYATARLLNVSTANITKEHQRLTAALWREHAAARFDISERVGNITPLANALEQLNFAMQEASDLALQLGVSTANLSREHQRLAAAIIREHQAAIDAQALSIIAPFEQMLDPLREFARGLTLGNLNPADQMKAAQDEFRRIAELARAGSTIAIQQLQGAGQAFISEMERFGASPGGAAARIEVQSVIEAVMADIAQAQREASSGVEDAIAVASQRQVDTLRELITETRLVGEEIKRLRR